jgi:hypothetical protein
MISTSPGIRAIALEQFNGRLKVARQQAATMGDSWPGDPANENLRLWLAIALAAGVGRDLPADICRAIEKEAIFPHKAKFLPLPSEIAVEHAWKSELARARDAAIAKSEQRARDLRAEQRARDLIQLAEALGAPAIDWGKAEAWGIAA